MSDSERSARHMKAIRAWIQRVNKFTDGAQSSSIDLMSLTDHNLRERLDDMESSRLLQEQPFVSNVMFIGQLIAKFRTIWNSVATKWFVSPLIQQQNNFNIRVVSGYSELIQYLNHIVFFARNIYVQMQNIEKRLDNLESAQTTSSDVVFSTVTISDVQIIETISFVWQDFINISSPVAILSCGTGDILKAVAQQNNAAYGIEADPVLVQKCLDKGLNAIQSNNVVHLRNLPADELGGILAIYRKSYSAWEITQLLDQARRVLAPDTWMILIWAQPAAMIESNIQMAKQIAVGMSFQRVRIDVLLGDLIPLQFLTIQK